MSYFISSGTRLPHDMLRVNSDSKLHLVLMFDFLPSAKTQSVHPNTMLQMKALDSIFPSPYFTC